jgi:hypothetical protein
MMTYELCASALPRPVIVCPMTLKLGARLTLAPKSTCPGAFPAHTPRFAIAPDGTILLMGQLIETPALKLGERNGRVCAPDAQSPSQTSAPPIVNLSPPAAS